MSFFKYIICLNSYLLQPDFFVILEAVETTTTRSLKKCVYVCMCIYVCVCAYTYVDIHIYIYIYTYTYRYIYTHLMYVKQDLRSRLSMNNIIYYIQIYVYILIFFLTF